MPALRIGLRQLLHLTERICFEHSSGAKGSTRRYQRLVRLLEAATDHTFKPHPRPRRRS